jgi:hypothetical protein
MISNVNGACGTFLLDLLSRNEAQQRTPIEGAVKLSFRNRCRSEH